MDGGGDQCDAPEKCGSTVAVTHSAEYQGFVAIRDHKNTEFGLHHCRGVVTGITILYGWFAWYESSGWKLVAYRADELGCGSLR